MCSLSTESREKLGSVVFDLTGNQLKYILSTAPTWDTCELSSLFVPLIHRGLYTDHVLYLLFQCYH